MIDGIFLDDYYYSWLCSFILDSSYSSEILDYLYNTNFQYKLLLDNNRSSDVYYLREKYYVENKELFYDIGIGSNDPFWTKQSSVLEVILSLVMHMSDNLDTSFAEKSERNLISKLFIELVDNLCFYDKVGDLLPTDFYINGIVDEFNIESKVLNWMNRKYEYNGKGGLFPLSDAKEDQRKLELWYQMHQYMDEKYPYVD